MTAGKDKMTSNSDALHVARGLRCYFLTNMGAFSRAFEVLKRMDEVSGGSLETQIGVHLYYKIQYQSSFSHDWNDNIWSAWSSTD
jgi:hypothetical protein